MAVTQTLMTDVARTVQRVLGTSGDEGAFERVTYLARATMTSVPTRSRPLDGLFSRYSESVITAHLAVGAERALVQRDDRLLRLATADMTWTPTLADSVERADGSLWRVMALAGGLGKPFWRLQMRRIPGQ